MTKKAKKGKKKVTKKRESDTANKVIHKSGLPTNEMLIPKKRKNQAAVDEWDEAMKKDTN